MDIALEGEIIQVGLVNSTYLFLYFLLLLIGVNVRTQYHLENKLPTMGNGELLETSL
jgi:hypothetical protein